MQAIVKFDDPRQPIAETCRRVGAEAERLGLPRPSYQRVRELVHRARRLKRRGPSTAQVLVEIVYRWHGRLHYIQDGGHPQIVNWIVESSYQLQVIRKALRLSFRLLRHWLRLDRRSDIGKEIADFWSPGDLSSSSIPLFSMGRDIPNGRMSLTKDGYLDLDWKIDRSNEYFNGVRATGKQIADALNGKFVDNAPWHLSRSVTVHPVGGCPMGRNVDEGVVDSYGRVFGYPGLYVADGSVLPGPVGPNPSNTIAALAHRFADQLIADAG